MSKKDFLKGQISVLRILNSQLSDWLDECLEQYDEITSPPYESELTDEQKAIQSHQSGCTSGDCE